MSSNRTYRGAGKRKPPRKKQRGGSQARLDKEHREMKRRDARLRRLTVGRDMRRHDDSVRLPTARGA